MSVRSSSISALLCLSALIGCASNDDGASSNVLAQETTAIDASTPAPTQGADAGATKGPLSGSAAANSCSYFSKPGGDKCNGYYCGVSEAQIASALPADSVCGNATDACTGSLTDKLTECTRNIVIANLGTPGAQLKSKIEECMWADANTKANVKPACLGCFVDSAICIVDNCLIECSSEGAGCDTCRKEKNCVQGTFACAGLPDPL
ncbi:MAG: hypothetical protein ABW252_23815 [Polyangiales bacterium]